MIPDHAPRLGRFFIGCNCGWKSADVLIDLQIKQYAEHYALETQAAKPRARRGGVDESEPTSKSHRVTQFLLGDAWQTADGIYTRQGEIGANYSAQRIRTCLAGLVRAGIAEERKLRRFKEYRLKESK